MRKNTQDIGTINYNFRLKKNEKRNLPTRVYESYKIKRTVSFS